MILHILLFSSHFTVCAYTCTLSGNVQSHHNHKYGKPSLLCRHGTKSSSGVFDARRITILCTQIEEDQDVDISNESSSNAAFTVENDNIDAGDNGCSEAVSSKREKLHRLLQRMRDATPRLRLSLPSFLSRMALSPFKESNDDAADETPSLDEHGKENVMQSSETNAEGEKEDRSATAASHVDLSGTWRPIATTQFKAEYDQYLQNCTQSYMYRKVIVNGIALQKEIIHQLDNGTNLQIVASNPAGNWDRTLVASTSQNPVHVTIKDPDGDTVQVEAWWEDNGRVHKSWLRNKPRLLGGAFETSRYLSEEDPNILLCDSVFHPSSDVAAASKGFKYGRVLWQFRREE